MEGSSTGPVPAVCLGPASAELTAQVYKSVVVFVVRDVLYGHLELLCNVVDLEQVESVAKGIPCRFAPGREPD